VIFGLFALTHSVWENGSIINLMNYQFHTPSFGNTDRASALCPAVGAGLPFLWFVEPVMA
jgi:hypothetical protein